LMGIASAISHQTILAMSCTNAQVLSVLAVLHGSEECKIARIQECKNTRIQECKNIAILSLIFDRYKY